METDNAEYEASCNVDVGDVDNMGRAVSSAVADDNDDDVAPVGIISGGTLRASADGGDLRTRLFALGGLWS